MQRKIIINIALCFKSRKMLVTFLLLLLYPHNKLVYIKLILILILHLKKSEHCIKQNLNNLLKGAP